MNSTLDGTPAQNAAMSTTVTSIGRRYALTATWSAKETAAHHPARNNPLRHQPHRYRQICGEGLCNFAIQIDMLAAKWQQQQHSGFCK